MSNFTNSTMNSTSPSVFGSMNTPIPSTSFYTTSRGEALEPLQPSHVYSSNTSYFDDALEDDDDNDYLMALNIGAAVLVLIIILIALFACYKMRGYEEQGQESCDESELSRDINRILSIKLDVNLVNVTDTSSSDDNCDDFRSEQDNTKLKCKDIRMDL